jgi:hypothetical protein
MSDTRLLEVITDLRNWVRAASHSSVKALLETALPDAKARMAYQLSDGATSQADIRSRCKLSPNAVVALLNRCVSLGLMEATDGGKKRRLFDLRDFGLLSESDLAPIVRDKPKVKK